MKCHNVYNLVFISTFIDNKHIDSLIDTVIKNNNIVTVFFIIINQTKSELVFPYSSFIDFHQIMTDRISLSKARNIGINYLLDNNLYFEHIMFPDDDTTFSDSFFSRYNECIKKDQNYLIDVYCEGTDTLFKRNNHIDGCNFKKNDHEAAMSVNMIVNYRTFIKVGLFDERIGVGSKYGSGEDGDYFIRACDLSINGFIYNKMIFNFHPSSENKFKEMNLSKTIKTFINYGNGAIFVLCKHKMYVIALKICFSAIGGALISMYKLDLKLFLAYGTAFFSRLIMFLKCLINHKRYKYYEVVV